MDQDQFLPDVVELLLLILKHFLDIRPVSVFPSSLVIICKMLVAILLKVHASGYFIFGIFKIIYFFLPSFYAMLS